MRRDVPTSSRMATAVERRTILQRIRWLPLGSAREAGLRGLEFGTSDTKTEMSIGLAWIRPWLPVGSRSRGDLAPKAAKHVDVRNAAPVIQMPPRGWLCAYG